MKLRMRSPYTPANPPPTTPPVGMHTPSQWSMWCRHWWRHQSANGKCQVCGSEWPCHSWPVYDGMIHDAVRQHRQFIYALATGQAHIPATFTDQEAARAQRAVDALTAATVDDVTVLVPAARPAPAIEGAA